MTLNCAITSKPNAQEKKTTVSLSAPLLFLLLSQLTLIYLKILSKWHSNWIYALFMFDGGFFFHPSCPIGEIHNERFASDMTWAVRPCLILSNATHPKYAPFRSICNGKRIESMSKTAVNYKFMHILASIPHFSIETERLWAKNLK